MMKWMRLGCVGVRSRRSALTNGERKQEKNCANPAGNQHHKLLATLVCPEEFSRAFVTPPPRAAPPLEHGKQMTNGMTNERNLVTVGSA